MDNEIYIYSSVVMFFALFSSFSAALEIAVVSSSRLKLEASAKKGKKSALRAISIIDRGEQAIGILLIVNNIAHIGAAAFTTFIATMYFKADETGIVIITAVQAVVFLIVCEYFPKILSRISPETFIMKFSLPTIFFMTLFLPANSVVIYFSKLIRKIINKGGADRSLLISREEIDILFRIGKSEGTINEDSHAFLSEILSLKKVIAYEIRTPMIDIVSIEKNQSVKDLIELIDESRFSRIPVYEDRVDNIIGYVFYRDILKEKKPQNISQFIMKPHYVPDTKNILELYFEMRENSIPVYFVVNEFGGVIGMVTHEDIAEEIVGEIHTRDHAKEDIIIKINERKYSIHGNLDIDFFKRFFKSDVKKDGFSTIAGFILYLAGKIPKKGERVSHGRFTFIVDEGTDRQIERIIMTISDHKK